MSTKDVLGAIYRDPVLKDLRIKMQHGDSVGQVINQYFPVGEANIEAFIGYLEQGIEMRQISIVAGQRTFDSSTLDEIAYIRGVLELTLKPQGMIKQNPYNVRVIDSPKK